MHQINKIVYINLASQPAKRQHMETLLSSIGLPFERFEGIKPSAESLANKDGKYSYFFNKAAPWAKTLSSRQRGIFGCYLSHYYLLKKYLGHKSHLLVLEDDVFFKKEIIQEINSIISSSAEALDWDLLRVMWPWHLNAGAPWRCALIKISNYLYKFKSPHRCSKFGGAPTPGAAKSKLRRHGISGGTHFTVINKNKIEKILKYMDSEKVYNIDSVYSTDQINSYVIDGVEVKYNIGESSILGMNLENSSIPKKI